MLDFGRYAGFSWATLAKQDPDYLEWLARTPIGRRYQAEIAVLLQAQARALAASRSGQRAYNSC